MCAYRVILNAAAGHGNIPVFRLDIRGVWQGCQDSFAEGDDSVLGTSALHRWSFICSRTGLPLVVGRLSILVSPTKLAYGMVLPSFCRAALGGESIEVHGDGEQSRCFYVADCVKAIVSLVDPLMIQLWLAKYLTSEMMKKLACGAWRKPLLI